MTLRLEPIPPGAEQHDCGFCGARADVYLLIRHRARLYRFRACASCRALWRTALERIEAA